MEKRYSIRGATTQQIKNAGGRDIKEAHRIGIAFATLDERGAAYLMSLGCAVSEIKEVRATITAPIMPPPPLPAVVGYTPVELLAGLGFTEEWRHVIEPPVYGEGLAIAIIDSGIRETHEMIKGRVVHSMNFTDSPMRDDFDHGTGVASIVLELAPKADILNIKVLDDKGMGTNESVALGIDHVIEIKETRTDIIPHVINLSLGEPDEGDVNDPVRVACRAAIEKGMLVVAAAGNAGPSPGTIMSPACERYVAAVGSVSYNPQDPKYPWLVSTFSSRGPTREGLIKPDAVLPGENIKMASSASDTAIVIKSGTSFSAPIASAFIILQAEANIKFVRWVYEYVPEWIIPGYYEVMTAQRALDYWVAKVCMKPDFAPMGKDTEYGYGIPCAELAGLALAGATQPSYTGIMNAVPIFLTFGFLGMLLPCIMKGD